MARPRLHDLDALLDAAEALLADGGERAVTIRAVADRAGAPSGSLYHAFGSRNELLGNLWLRAARRFLTLQRATVDAELHRAGWDGAVAATVAAASTLSRLRETAPASAQVLTSYRRESLLETGLSEELARQLADLDKDLLAVLQDLARALFGRRDRRSVETVAVCVVDFPPSLLDGRRDRIIDSQAVLEAAVRGVLQAARSTSSPA